MSIQSEINRISGNVSDTLDAISTKGVAVPADATSDNMAALVSAIPVSDGTIPDHTHDAATELTGVLPVANGGTGLSTTAKGAFYATAAGGAPKFGTLPIAQGGTGATSAANARTKLGLATGSWTPAVTGFSSTTSAVGHYMKIGEYVTISFFVRGTPNGSTGTVYITGIPFTADTGTYWYAGGGHWQGGQIALGSYANCRFDGYVLQSSNNRIYPRVTGTSATSGSANITAGYVAATGSAEIYAGGTIMYLATS